MGENEIKNHKELPSKYNPHGLEQKWYKTWEENKYFDFKNNHAHVDFEKLSDGELKKYIEENGAYSIVIPPPNVTGSLHLGHALNHTIQDILTRRARMQGKVTLWVPGQDHAGIATQNVVEKLLLQEGTSRQDMTRSQFEKKVWEWKEKSGGMITHQQRQLGESVNWDFERFTLSDELSSLVKKTFIKLFDDGLIYRAERMINWCPVNKTALSNIEVEYKEVQGKLYYIKYALKKPTVDVAHVVIATTRPETMLGDEALAVHPDDERYKNFVGKKVILPLINKEIPIIADDFVDMKFGSGIVKITPAHDPNDFEAGKRHSLPITRVIDDEGNINENGGSYAGLTREKARIKIVEDLEEKELIVETKKHVHQVGHNSRSGAVVEPFPSLQWFVKVKPLAKKSIEVVEQGKIKFHPKRWENTYFEWMRNIQDWCISRQLWWGHRIPAWYDNEGNIYVAEDEAAVRKKHSLADNVQLRQDEDVLDTWFSSGLWPFATLWENDQVHADANKPWPKKNTWQKMFYPTSVLVTGFDIIFFWVARMIMFGLHMEQEIPFHDVFIHGLVRDAERKKMSKSTGNVVNPLEKMEEYGTDAFRFFMMSIMPEGKDIVFDESRLKGYMAFCNKIWNTARFIWMNQDASYSLPQEASKEICDNFSDIDLWILSELETTINKSNQAIDNYRFADYAQLMYDFTWKSFCGYYLEFSKVPAASPEKEKARQYTLNFVFLQIIHLLHPIMPYITEELFSFWANPSTSLKEQKSNYLIVSQWPDVTVAKLLSKLNRNHQQKANKSVSTLTDILYRIRNLRGELGLPPKNQYPLVIVFDKLDDMKNISTFESIITKLVNIEKLELTTEKSKTFTGVKSVFDGGLLYLDLKGEVDLNQEKEKFVKQQANIQRGIDLSNKKLNNPGFADRAPKELVDAEKQKKADLQEKLKHIEDFISSLG